MWTCGLQIRVVEGAAKGRSYPLDAPHITIGRLHPEATQTIGSIFIKDDTVSRLQAELRWNEEAQSFILTNRSETNPTRVNENVVEEVLLAAGDQIRMGLCVLDLQQADMRFGGSPDRAAAKRAASANLKPPPPLPTRGLDDEKLASTKKAGRVASLTLRPAFTMNVVAGPLAGQSQAITGLIIALGGPGAVPVLEKAEKWFDQEIILDSPDLPPRCLALSWKELRHGFELSRVGAPNLPVTLERLKDGLDWVTPLPTDRPALVLPNDSITLHPHVLKITIPTAEKGKI